MPKVANRLVDKEKMDQFYADFWNAVALLDSRKEAQNFFYDLLTHTERKMLAKRFQVAIMLIQGNEYQKIRETVGVANSTITRINNWLKTGAFSLDKIARKIIDNEKQSVYKKTSNGKGYLAGDLLFPALEEGANLIARQINKRRRNK